jgi:hypothetical protein
MCDYLIYVWQDSRIPTSKFIRALALAGELLHFLPCAVLAKGAKSLSVFAKGFVIFAEQFRVRKTPFPTGKGVVKQG